MATGSFYVSLSTSIYIFTSIFPIRSTQSIKKYQWLVASNRPNSLEPTPLSRRLRHTREERQLTPPFMSQISMEPQKCLYRTKNSSYISVARKKFEFR